MNSKHDDDELNFTIHQRSLYGQTVKLLTVRAIIVAARIAHFLP